MSTGDAGNILVLTLHTGGHYYGETLSGVLREAASAGRHVVVVETRDPGGLHGDRSWGPAFDHPLARNRIAGVVCVANAATPAYLQSLRDEGIPVVVATEVHGGFEGPIAMPDNAAAIHAAMQHLIDHGHERIGFVGSLDIRDFRERQAAYLEAMAEHGLAQGEDLYFPAPDYSADGGAAAAELILTHPSPPTAVVTATDANAFGLIRRLTEAGIRVPDDIAVLGFDNVEEGAYTSPSLSSVGQRFQEVGALAARLLLRLMDGEDVPAGSQSPESVILARRASCGCRTDLEHGTHTTPAVPAPSSVHSPVAGLLSSLPSKRREALEGVLARVETLARADVEPTAQDVVDVVHGLRDIGDDQDAAVADLVEHVLQLPAEEGADRPEGHSAVLAMLWELRARGHRRSERHLDEAAIELEWLASALLRRDAGHVRSLGWLDGTHVRAGVLALWKGSPADGVLEVAGVHDPDGLTDHHVGEELTVRDFPGAAISAAGDTWAGEMCVVVPVASRDQEWGLMTLLGRLDTRSVREPYHRLSELLYWAIEGERLQQQVRSSEERYAWAARASNDGLWELDLRTGNLFASGRCRELLGIPAGQMATVELWEELIHPDDAEMVRELMIRAATQAKATEIEYRLNTPDGVRRWVLSRSLGVTDESGTVHKVVGSLADVTTRRELEEQLRQAALYDEVTGLPNRRLFRERLEKAIDRTQRDPRAHYAVIFLDLDGFKLVNDSLGHLVGDDLLRVVAQRLRAQIRSVDTAARFGGDEFAVLLIDPVDEELLAVADRLQGAIARTVTLVGHEVGVTASAGIATSASGYTAAEDVLRDADTAMYRSKETRRGTATLFDPRMHTQATDRLRIRSELRVALEQQQFVMHYQPVVALDGSEVAAFEALVRWEHPVRGLVGPTEFLGVMEQDTSIVELGRWVVDQVCRQVAIWQKDLGLDVSVSVNISHLEFWADDVVQELVAATRRHRVDPSSLQLEITESVIMNDLERALERMTELRSHGFGLHVDDFGTGQSSLHALQALPVDTIKIDGAFIRELSSGPRAEALVRAIMAMADALGIDTVAECVETEEQADRLQAMGCAGAQGWLYAHALPADEATGILGRRLAAPRSTLPA